MAKSFRPTIQLAQFLIQQHCAFLRFAVALGYDLAKFALLLVSLRLIDQAIILLFPSFDWASSLVWAGHASAVVAGAVALALCRFADMTPRRLRRAFTCGHFFRRRSPHELRHFPGVRSRDARNCRADQQNSEAANSNAAPSDP